jgi:plasmid stabilization system protein ParE
MSDFRFTPEAAADLFEIWTYIASDNQDAADRVEAAVLDVCDFLVQNLKAAGCAESSRDVRSGSGPSSGFLTTSSYIAPRHARLRSSVSYMACAISSEFCELRSLKLPRAFAITPLVDFFFLQIQPLAAFRSSPPGFRLLLSSQHAIVLHPRVFPVFSLPSSLKHEKEFIVTKHKTTSDATQSCRKTRPWSAPIPNPKIFRHPSDTYTHPPPWTPGSRSTGRPVS